MNSLWPSALTAAGIEHTNGAPLMPVAADQTAVTSSGDTFSILANYGVLRVSGADAEPFLQGQFTADVATLGSTHSRLGAWCTPKGRVIFLARLLRDGDDFLLLLPLEQVEDCIRRLRLYILRAKVSAEPEPGLLVAGLCGDKTGTAVLEEAGLEWPAANMVSRSATFCALGLGPTQVAGRERALLLANDTAMAELLSSLRQRSNITLVGPPAWTLLDIESGQPWLEPALSEQFLPQMLNLDHLEGISFDKGCYVGQEIVARTQYLGRLKKRLYKGRVATDATLSPGDALYVPGTDKSSSGAVPRGDHAAGTIVSAGTDVHGRWAVLAVCSIDDASTGDLHVHHVLGPTLELEALPYSVSSTQA